MNPFGFKLLIRLAKVAQEFNPTLFKPRQERGMMRHAGLVGLGIAHANAMGVGRATSHVRIELPILASSFAALWSMGSVESRESVGSIGLQTQETQQTQQTQQTFLL